MSGTRVFKISAKLLLAAYTILAAGCSSPRFTTGSENDPVPAAVEKRKDPAVKGGIEKHTEPDFAVKLYEKCADLLSAGWKNPDNILQLIPVIREASADGLNPGDYHLNEIEELSKKIVSSVKTDVGDVGRLEFLLSDALSALSSDLSHGETDPKLADPRWGIARTGYMTGWKINADSILRAGSIRKSINDLAPKNHEYLNLKDALRKYQSIEENGGWGLFSTKMTKLEEGMSHPDIVSLRKRLESTFGNFGFRQGEEAFFDDTLKTIVVQFQKLNGLDPDGVVGKATIEAFNVPVEERIKTLEANLERWRWLNGDLPHRYIMVNIPGFRLRVIDHDSAVLQSLAIVGRLYRQTPVFNAMLKYVVLNPEWSIPRPILEDEILPEIMKDQTYLKKNDMEILDYEGAVINPASIDWNNLSIKEFPYMIKQTPGPGNPLGHIKFIFPNSSDVYIHDTPSRSLFSRSTRAYSHGCIRIDQAHELAQYILKDNSAWNPEDLKKAIDSGEERTIVLKDPVPVYILYFTAWADNDGTAYFAKDIYNRDQMLISALEKAHPHGN